MRSSFRRKAIQYSGLRRLIAGLRQVASGEVMERALGRVQNYVGGRIKGELGRHVYTGHALRTARVELAPKAIDIRLQKYRRYIRWSWRKGIPISALRRAQKIIREEMLLAVKEGP